MIEGTGGNWFLFKDEDLSGLSDCDGNNGFIGMQAEFIDDWSALVTGRISLAGTTNPYLTSIPTISSTHSAHPIRTNSKFS